jgi:quercetin dioxygenase-like cupin family protein
MVFEHANGFRAAFSTKNKRMEHDSLRAILPEEVDWKPFAAFPPNAYLAVLLGHPSEPGLYVIRIKVAAGAKLMPHRHPENRIYTVMSGIFYIGVGGEFDAGKLTAYPTGSMVLLPGGTPHFHWARSGEYITQVMGLGPLGTEYMSRSDDPRTFQ